MARPKRREDPAIRDSKGALDDFYKTGNADTELYDTSGMANNDEDRALKPEYEKGRDASQHNK